MPSKFSKSPGRYVALAAGTAVTAYAGNKVYQSYFQKGLVEDVDLNNQSVEIDPVEHIRRGVQYATVDMNTYYKTVCPNVQTLGDIFYNGYALSNNGPCITDVDLSNQVAPVNWITYKTALERIRYIGSHIWTQAKLTPMQSKVAILSTNRMEYIFAEHACYIYGFTVIGLYTTYDATTILSMLEKTEAEVLIIDNLNRISKFKNELLRMTQLKEILVMDEITGDENEKIQSIPSVLKTMQQAEVRPIPKIDPDSIATFILTSGTTGEPKLAMLSHNNILSTIKALIDRRERTNSKTTIDSRHCSFLPMAHLYERINLIYYFLCGSQIACCPIPERLFEYYAIIKPTTVSMVPRILNKVYDMIMTEVNKSRVKRFLITQALHFEKPSVFSKLIFRKVKNLFGGEVSIMITGSAPITREVLHFFRIALNAPIAEAYGQTESSAAGSVTHIMDLSCGKVGPPGPVTEIKLIDVPNTNYRSNNNQGEICIRGPAVFKGYYKDEAKTRETIDEGGWLHTGDVGEWTSDGTLRIIDRTKHIFKLSQGEYIAPERLEDFYTRSRWVAQIFVDGISSESTVVAIVIPDEEYVRSHLKIKASTSFEEICKDGKLKEIILKDLQRLAKENKFKYYETVTNIHLHSELFSQENGLITSTLKTRRAAARQYFQKTIQSLYNSGEHVIKPLNVEVQSNL